MITRAIDAARHAGMKVGGIELSPDGVIRVLSDAQSTEMSPYDRWKSGIKKPYDLSEDFDFGD
jgi:hypothetical protein